MKIIFFILFSLTSIFSFAQTNEEQDVLSLCRKKFKWMVEAKLDSLSDVLDDRLTYIHSSGQVQNKTDFLSDFSKFTYKAIDLKELKVRVYKGAAIINGLGKFSVMVNGTLVSYDLMFTETYVFIGKKWKLAARHSNKME
jgi:hypothetical protein